MEHRISATELARRLGDVLGKIRYLGDTFVIEKNGDPVALMTPLQSASPVTVREALATWRQAGEPDEGFAADLETVNSADRPPKHPWVW